MYNALEYLERSAEKYPDKVAFADVKKEITYSELVVRERDLIRIHLFPYLWKKA